MLATMETPATETETPADASAGVNATLGPKSDHEKAFDAIAGRIIDLCITSRDVHTETCFSIGDLIDDAITLNCKAHPAVPKHGKAGIVPQTINEIRGRMATSAPWALRTGHPTEYRRAAYLRALLGDDGVGLGRLSFDTIRVLVSCVQHNEAEDTFTIRETIEAADGTFHPCAYRTYLTDRIADLADKPEAATVVRKALRKWETDRRADLLSEKDKRKADRKAEAEKDKAKDAARSAFLADLPVKLAELNIPNNEIERALISKNIIPERAVIVEPGATPPSLDPATMTPDDLTDFVRQLLQTEDDARILAVWNPMKAWAMARQGALKSAPSPRPSLNDAPGVNVVKIANAA